MFGSRTEVDMHNFTFENIVLGSGKKARGTTYTYATEDPLPGEATLVGVAPSLHQRPLATAPPSFMLTCVLLY